MNTSALMRESARINQLESVAGSHCYQEATKRLPRGLGMEWAGRRFIKSSGRRRRRKQTLIEWNGTRCERNVAIERVVTKATVNDKRGINQRPPRRCSVWNNSSSNSNNNSNSNSSNKERSLGLPIGGHRRSSLEIFSWHFPLRKNRFRFSWWGFWWDGYRIASYVIRARKALATDSSVESIAGGVSFLVQRLARYMPRCQLYQHDSKEIGSWKRRWPFNHEAQDKQWSTTNVIYETYGEFVGIG